MVACEFADDASSTSARPPADQGADCLFCKQDTGHEMREAGAREADKEEDEVVERR